MNIYFYANAPGADWLDGGDAPTGGPGDPTPTALHHVYLAEGEFIQGEPEWLIECSAELPEPFVADPDTPYWIEIQGVMVFPPCYGWVIGDGSVDGWGSTQGAPVDSPPIPYWSRADDDWTRTDEQEPADAVFTLYGQPSFDADINQDRDVDMIDVNLFLSCFSGEGNPYDLDRIYCYRSNLDEDDDVDLVDFLRLQSQLGGPES